MKPAPFEYLRPASLEEALDALAQNGGDAQVLAGGQSLMPLMAHRRARPSVLVDINRVEALDSLISEQSELRIGALVRHVKLEARGLGVLSRAAVHIGNREVRNRGTFCGSLAHGDPTAEWPLLAVALGGRVVLRSTRGEREVTAETFFVGPFATVRSADELIYAAKLPHPAGFAFFDEISPCFAAPALANLALVATATGLCLAVGGMTDKPTVLTATAAEIENGAEFGEIAQSLRKELADKVVTADPKYRLRLAEIQLGRAVARYREEAAGDGH